MTDTTIEALKTSIEAANERPQVQTPAPRTKAPWELERARIQEFDAECEKYASDNNLTLQEARLEVTLRKKAAELLPSEEEKSAADDRAVESAKEKAEQRRNKAATITAQWSAHVDQRTELLRKITRIKDLTAVLTEVDSGFRAGGVDTLCNTSWNLPQILEQLSHAAGAQLGVATLTAALPIKEAELVELEETMRALGKLHNIPRNFWP